MTITIGQAYLAKQVLDKMMNETFTGKQAFTIARLAKAVEKEVALFEEQRQALIKRYADKDENGETKVDDKGMVHIDDSKLHELNSELNDMLSAEISIETKPLKTDWFENISITPAELQAMEPFIEE